MKKFYAFAAAACVALAANAETNLYATGNGDFAGGQWAPAKADQFVYADGVYTLEVKNLVEFKISTALGDPEGVGDEAIWAPFNAAAYDCPDGYGDIPDVAVALQANADAKNIQCPWKGDYTITVAGDLSTITLSTKTPKPDDTVHIYMRGDMNSWLNPVFGSDPTETIEFAQAWEFKEVEGADGVYSLTCGADQSVKIGEGFKIADSDWFKYEFGGGEEKVALGADYEVYLKGGSNMQFAADWKGVCYLDMRNVDDEGYWLWASNDKSAKPEWLNGDDGAVSTIATESNDAPVFYNLQGVRVANADNGLFIVVKGGKATKIVK